MDSTTLKVVLFGAGSVGKSAFTIRYVLGSFVDHYDPTIEDLYRKIIQLEGQNYMLEILDTAGTESFLSMRDLYIKNAQGFILMYSVASRSSFSEMGTFMQQIMNVKDYVDHKQVPFVMVGNKCDLEDLRMISLEEGEKLAKEWDNCCFMEASAKTQINVEKVFEEVTRQILRKIPSKERDLIERKKKKARCSIL